MGYFFFGFGLIFLFILRSIFFEEGWRVFEFIVKIVEELFSIFVISGRFVSEYYCLMYVFGSYIVVVFDNILFC